MEKRWSTRQEARTVAGTWHTSDGQTNYVETSQVLHVVGSSFEYLSKILLCASTGEYDSDGKNSEGEFEQTPSLTYSVSPQPEYLST